MSAGDVEMRQRQALHGTGDDDVSLDVQLHPKPGVNPAKLQETAAERASGKMGLSPIRKELAAAHADAAAGAVEDNDFVNVVSGDDSQRLKRLQFIDLAAVSPVEVSPVIQNGDTGDKRSPVELLRLVFIKPVNMRTHDASSHCKLCSEGQRHDVVII